MDPQIAAAAAAAAARYNPQVQQARSSVTPFQVMLQHVAERRVLLLSSGAE